MARLPRPHIPLRIRVTVAARQLLGWHDEKLPSTTATIVAAIVSAPLSDRAKLDHLLDMLASRLRCEVKELHLDHDPALVNRKKTIRLPNGRRITQVVVPRGGEVICYFPDANDPEHLIYRVKDAHDVKTRVRGEHGQLSDLALARKERRRVKKATRKKTAWPKGRKLQSRNTLRRRK